MNKKWIYLFMLSLFILSGCASLNGNVPFQYQPSLTSANKKINKIVGLNLLVDKRPKEDISNTESIKDLPDKITSKLLEDFQKSEIFAKIHYNTEAEDEIVINGSINRFKWKATPNGLMFIPFLNLLIYFGIPTYDITGVTVITLEVKDNKSGQIIKTFRESSESENTYNLYNFKTGDAGAELAESFRDVAKKLKEDLLNKSDLAK